jgi:hypothetical protein
MTENMQNVCNWVDKTEDKNVLFDSDQWCRTLCLGQAVA